MSYKTILVAIGAAALTVGTTLADVIAVGTGKTHTFTNAADVVQTDAVRVADRTTLVQQGGGKTTLQSGTFVENKPVALNVSGGSVRIEESAPLLATYAKPTDVLNKAAFWVDASETASLKLREGTENEVATWLDVRETGAGTTNSPYAYMRAVAFTNEKLTAYPLVQGHVAKEGTKTGVYCRGYGSGCFMNWVMPDDSQVNLKGIRHAFVVHGSVKGKTVGDFLGQRQANQNAPYFQRAGTTALWVTHNGQNVSLYAARTYLDGEEVDPALTSYDREKTNHIYMVEVETDPTGPSLGAMCFYNDRDMQLSATDGTTELDENGAKINAILGEAAMNGGGNRAGGDYLFEVVVFTNNLTTAERFAVSDWLNEKWRGVTPPAAAPAVTVATASNTVVEVGAVALAEGSAITGDGTIRKTGDGAFTMPPAFEPRNSALHAEVQGGTLNLSSALPLTLAAGDTVLSTQKLYGTEISVTASGADATRLVKDGDGPITIDAIPAGVTQLAVNGGELHLSAPLAAQKSVAQADEVVSVAFPDPGFETYPATKPTACYSYITNGKEANGWHAIVPAQYDGKGDSAVFFYDQSLGSPTGWGMVLQDPASGVFVVKNNGSAWCEIEIPRDGEYVLSFRSAPRSSYIGEQLDVMIGDNADSLESFGDFRTTTSAWQTFTFVKKRLTAGKKQFWLKSKENNTDRCTQFDDFSLVRVAETCEWTLPNGGFEHHDAGFKDSLVATNAYCVTGYAVTQRTDMTGTLAVRDSSTFVPKSSVGAGFFNLPWNKEDSATQFIMSGEGPTLTTTFTPPAGTWKFRADFCYWAADWQAGYLQYAVAAKLAVGGDEIDLGTVTTNARQLVARTWPKAFTVDGQTAVTLTLTGAGVGSDAGYRKYARGILDNLVLVRETENLFADGGFESTDSQNNLLNWTVAKTAKPKNVSGSSIREFGSFFEQNYGFGKCEGAKCWMLVNDDAVYQSVTFATGGLYRVSANFMSRCDPKTIAFWNWGKNPVAVYFARNGVTNWVGTTDNAATTNFNEYAYYVQVPAEGGTWDVGFRGTAVWGGDEAAPVDRTMLVDAAMLYRVETEASIDLPQELEITVAKGAKLALDFDGTCEVARLRIGGRAYSGEVSVGKHPELDGVLVGRGALFVRPRGLMLIIR